MDFVVVDVETANPNFSSICQIGVAPFKGGRLHSLWDTYVNPDDEFDPWHASFHGITQSMVRQAPTWSAVHSTLREVLEGTNVASHTSFDRASLGKACARYGLQPHQNRWLDTASVVRRAWPQFSRKGYNLKNISGHLGIEFRHHDAKEDARAAGEVLLRAIEISGIDLDSWYVKSKQPITPSSIKASCSEPDPYGVLAGEAIVFTGALSMPRREAAELAARAGCEVQTTVNKNTTLLVVGDQDVARLIGHEKSSKHRKAESLIASGQSIRVVGESDFLGLLAQSGERT